MSAKPLKSVGRARKADILKPREAEGWRNGRGEAYTGKDAGRRGAARPLRLIQPRKKMRDVGGEAFKMAEASTEGAFMVSAGGPAGVSKTVACIQRSVYELGRPRFLPAACGVGATNQKEEP